MSDEDDKQKLIELLKTRDEQIMGLMEKESEKTAEMISQQDDIDDLKDLLKKVKRNYDSAGRIDPSILNQVAAATMPRVNYHQRINDLFDKYYED